VTVTPEMGGEIDSLWRDSGDRKYLFYVPLLQTFYTINDLSRFISYLLQWAVLRYAITRLDNEQSLMHTVLT
jgi:hypothetical protein